MQTLSLSKLKPSDLTPIIRADATPTICMSCGHSLDKGESHLTMESVTRIDHGWETTGHIECPSCGMAIKTVRREIELAASTFRCSKCGQDDTLEYEIENVAPRTNDVKDGFTFDVSVTCGHCKRKKSFKKILKSVLDVIKIKVGPDGVEIGKAE